MKEEKERERSEISNFICSLSIVRCPRSCVCWHYLTKALSHISRRISLCRIIVAIHTKDIAGSVHGNDSKWQWLSTQSAKMSNHHWMYIYLYTCIDSVEWTSYLNSRLYFSLCRMNVTSSVASFGMNMYADSSFHKALFRIHSYLFTFVKQIPDTKSINEECRYNARIFQFSVEYFATVPPSLSPPYDMDDIVCWTCARIEN